jgi:hypothetical protein
MKTATIPSLRVDPQLRDAAEAVLQDGETLSSFVEKSIRTQIDWRQTQQAFVTRGLASKNQARLDNEYYSADQVIAELDAMLDQAETQNPNK